MESCPVDFARQRSDSNRVESRFSWRYRRHFRGTRGNAFFRGSRPIRPGMNRCFAPGANRVFIVSRPFAFGYRTIIRWILRRSVEVLEAQPKSQKEWHNNESDVAKRNQEFIRKRRTCISRPIFRCSFRRFHVWGRGFNIIEREDLLWLCSYRGSEWRRPGNDVGFARWACD